MQRLTQPKVLFQTTKHSLHRLSKYSKKEKTIPKMYNYNFPDYAANLGLEQLKDYKIINK